MFVVVLHYLVLGINFLFEGMVDMEYKLQNDSLDKFNWNERRCFCIVPFLFLHLIAPCSCCCRRHLSILLSCIDLLLKEYFINIPQLADWECLFVNILTLHGVVILPWLFVIVSLKYLGNVHTGHYNGKNLLHNI